MNILRMSRGGELVDKNYGLRNNTYMATVEPERSLFEPNRTVFDLTPTHGPEDLDISGLIQSLTEHDLVRDTRTIAAFKDVFVNVQTILGKPIDEPKMVDVWGIAPTPDVKNGYQLDLSSPYSIHIKIENGEPRIIPESARFKINLKTLDLDALISNPTERGEAKKKLDALALIGGGKFDGSIEIKMKKADAEPPDLRNIDNYDIKAIKNGQKTADILWTQAFKKVIPLILSSEYATKIVKDGQDLLDLATNTATSDARKLDYIGFKTLLTSDPLNPKVQITLGSTPTLQGTPTQVLPPNP